MAAQEPAASGSGYVRASRRRSKGRLPWPDVKRAETITTRRSR